MPRQFYEYFEDVSVDESPLDLKETKPKPINGGVERSRNSKNLGTNKHAKELTKPRHNCSKQNAY